MPTPPAAVPPAASAADKPADPNKVILTIGDTKFTEAQYQALVDALPQQYQSYARGAGKRQFAENLAQLLILSNQAEKLGLDKQPKIQEQVRFQRQNLLAQAMFDDIQNGVKVDDALVDAYYNAHKNEYESVRAKHILIRVKGAPMPGAEGKPELTDEQALAKAQEIRKKLVDGGDFAAIAKTESDDTGSAKQGGDLGEFRHGMMVPPFEQAAFSLKVGEVSQPVKSPFGYHIIVVQDHKLKTLAEVRQDIEKSLRPEMARKQVQALREKTPVTIDDGYFGAAPAPMPAHGAPPAAAPVPPAK
ncbi:MAG TPA: peptidylprolyl isomerase [Bryobacteraceae bacterium]|nr:peptidylprolyl isomerase [Bryobacteraceae bacterium]